MSPVVINLRSSLSTATAADLKIPPPDASGFNPPPSVVFGSFIPCNVNDLKYELLLDMLSARAQHEMQVPCNLQALLSHAGIMHSSSRRQAMHILSELSLLSTSLMIRKASLHLWPHPVSAGGLGDISSSCQSLTVVANNPGYKC